MKKCLFILAVLAIFNCYNASAQELKGVIPAASSGQRIEQDFGLGMISIKYYRPNTKGRKIFGEIEPYNIVWRTGGQQCHRYYPDGQHRSRRPYYSPGFLCTF